MHCILSLRCECDKYDWQYMCSMQSLMWEMLNLNKQLHDMLQHLNFVSGQVFDFMSRQLDKVQF